MRVVRLAKDQLRNRMFDLSQLTAKPIIERVNATAQSNRENYTQLYNCTGKFAGQFQALWNWTHNLHSQFIFSVITLVLQRHVRGIPVMLLVQWLTKPCNNSGPMREIPDLSWGRVPCQMAPELLCWGVGSRQCARHLVVLSFDSKTCSRSDSWRN